MEYDPRGEQAKKNFLAQLYKKGITKMTFVKVLLEYRDSSHLDDTKILSALDEDGNMIAVGENWVCQTEEGLLLSEHQADGSPRESNGLEKQKIEVLYLLPSDLKSGEEDRIAEVANEVLPLPPGYGVGQISCRDHIFTITSKAGNPSICGAYEVIKHEFHSVPYSCHTRGLTASVLELYYYEVLAESHQLYMEKETFKREMKERKKRTKTQKKKQIAEEDFHKDADNKYTCEQKINLWGVTTRLYVTFEENPENKKWTLKKCVNQINAHILWVEKHRKEIEQRLLDSDMVEWANHWVEGHDSFEEDGYMYYELEDGNVLYPITEKTFLENLYIQSIDIHNATSETAAISFFLDTVPSYFGDHNIRLFIHAEKDAQGTTWVYNIHKAGIAG